jgi:endonuclease III
MTGAPVPPSLVAAALDQAWPDAACELLWRDPWQLLVAAILSARATDAQVNQVCAVLHERLVTPTAYAILAPRDLVPVLRRLPLYQQKARALVEAARAILRRHAGQVPADLVELQALPGVGPKVAAVVAGNGFGVPAVAADTHVRRIAWRLGWTARDHAAEAAAAVGRAFPEADWVRRCHQLIRLGRTWCRAPAPRCAGCPLVAACPRQGVVG